MNFETQLRGGDPRSLGNAEQVVQYVLAHPDKLRELFECMFNQDAIVRMRAGDAVEKICRLHPDWFTPYIDRLLSDVAVIEQPSVQWHLAQMMGELKLSTIQQRRAIAILKNNLETAMDWIVLNYTLEAFAEFARKGTAELRQYFIKQLKKHQNSKHKSVAKRANKLLGSL